MKEKINAYEMNADTDLNKVVKCYTCSFKAVKAQFLDSNGKCPRCGLQIFDKVKERAKTAHLRGN